jgi:hypothetical protein
MMAFITRLKEKIVWKDYIKKKFLAASMCVGDTHIGAVSSDETDLHIKSSTGPPTSRDPHPSSLPLEAYSNTTSSILRTV